MTTTNTRFVAKNGLDNNANSIANLGVTGASLTLSGANALTLTTSGATNVTFPTSGTLATTAGTVATATNVAAGAANQIPFQSAAGTTAFSSKFTWNDTSNTFNLGPQNSTATTIQPAIATSTAQGSQLVVKGGDGFGAGGGALTLSGGGSSTSGQTAGAVNINGGDATVSAGFAGAVNIRGGTGVGGSGGVITFSTAATTSTTERLRISVNGGLGLSGANFGTTGQVLTSAGDAPPTWSSVSGPTLTATQIAFGNGSNAVSGSASFKWTDSTQTLLIGNGAASPSVVGYTPATGSGGTLLVQAGGSVDSNGGPLTISGGNTSSSASSGGNVTVAGGNGTAASNGFGGNALISGGTGTGAGGYVAFLTAATGAVIERIRVSPAGGLGLAGANYGTSGQVLTSNANATPSWTTIVAPAGTLSGTTLNSTVVSSSLTSVGTLASVTVTGNATAAAFIPSGSTVPTNGMYLSAANTLNWATNSALRLTLSATGDLTATGNVTAYSDERLKTNWRDLPVDLVANLAEVKVGIYDRTDVAATQVGVSAQSLQTVMPNAVMKDTDGMLSVAYGNAALAACIALAKEVQLLKAEIALLKAQ